MYGGMNIENKILNDLWVLDLITMEWLLVDYHGQTNNFPKPKFLASGEILENTGQIIIHGGKSTSEDKSLAFLNLNILLEIIRFKDISNYDDQYFNYVSKINNLWKIVEVESNIYNIIIFI